MDDCGEGRGTNRLMVEKLSLSCDRLLSHLQLACCPSHCASPLQGKDLLIHCLLDPELKALRLTGHHGDISAMVFGTGRDPLLLCSASADYVIVWDIQCCYRRTREGVVASGTVIGTLLGKVVHLSFCPCDERVAACSGDKVYILNSNIEEVLSVLAGHLGPLTAAEFCPWNKDILVSISEDRTFKVWGLKMEEILYQSAVLSASPLLSVLLLEKSRQLVTGSADGQVWSFTLPENHRCHLVTKLDLHKVQQRHQRHLDTVAPQTGGVLGITPDPVETAKPVLRICAYHRRLPDIDHGQQRYWRYWRPPARRLESIMARTVYAGAPSMSRGGGGTSRTSDSWSGPATTSLRRDTWNEELISWVWIGSSDGLYLVDLGTSELHMTLLFRDHPNLSITMAGSWAMSQGLDNSMIFVVTSLFEALVSVLEVNLLGSGSVDNLCQHLEGLSVMPRAPLMPESPLNAELKKKGPKPPTKTEKRGVKEQPLVFHTQVKSSGYTQSPRMKMFSPKTNVQKKTPGPTKTNKKIGCLVSDYPGDTAAPSVPHTNLSTVKTPTPVCCAQYSGDGKQILCGLGDRSVLLYKSSLTGTPAVYTGHDKAVSSVAWSHSRQWWLSASEDRTLRIWPTGSPEPAVTMGGVEKFSKTIRGAQFYYLDKFLLLASGPSLHLYLYHLDNTQDDIKRYQQRSAIKLTKCLETKSGTDITAVSVINDFYSYIVLVSGADRSIQVLDMNIGRVASQLPDAHNRAVHHITQNKGSMFSSQTPDSYNLFLTSAVTDGVKLWDLRTLRCVRRYENHLNRCHPCTAAFSPCGRFIASGSEDNCAYVYDIRSSSYLHKLQRHSDTILNVTFNPATPELLTGTLDGRLSLFHPGNAAIRVSLS